MYGGYPDPKEEIEETHESLRKRFFCELEELLTKYDAGLLNGSSRGALFNLYGQNFEACSSLGDKHLFVTKAEREQYFYREDEGDE
jgi:hypothetical protein